MGEPNADSAPIAHWNYRVLVRRAPIGDTGEWDESVQMIECYYDTEGNIVAWSDAVPTGNTVAELHRTLSLMTTVAGLSSLRSKDRRALTLDDLPGVQNDGSVVPDE